MLKQFPFYTIGALLLYSCSNKPGETDIKRKIVLDYACPETVQVSSLKITGTKETTSFIGLNGYEYTVTGEVFFGTADKGICSYRADATEGGNVCDNYYVFPNPVRHEYHGPIAITGLVGNASVKITDVSGQVVYQTKANGGQAVWNGNNFDGKRAQTGVYMVFVTNDDGSETCVTKMVFTN